MPSTKNNIGTVIITVITNYLKQPKRNFYYLHYIIYYTSRINQFYLENKIIDVEVNKIKTLITF